MVFGSQQHRAWPKLLRKSVSESEKKQKETEDRLLSDANVRWIGLESQGSRMRKESLRSQWTTGRSCTRSQAAVGGKTQ